MRGVHFRGARGGAYQADHRDQGGTDRGRGQGGGEHTGSLAGSDDVLDAAFKRAGVLRVRTISDLFYMAEVLARQPRPQGQPADHRDQRGRAGGAGDRNLITEGGELTPISTATMAELNKLLPPAWATTIRWMSWATRMPCAMPGHWTWWRGKRTPTG